MSSVLWRGLRGLFRCVGTTVVFAAVLMDIGRTAKALGAGTDTNCAAGLSTTPVPTATHGDSGAAVALSFSELFKHPVGPRGLEYSAKARELEGRLVRVCGHVVRQSPPVPWRVLLSPVAVTLHDLEFGLCDELPASAVRLILPRATPPVLPPVPGLVTVEGILELGLNEEADGRTTAARIRVAPAAPGEPVRFWRGTNTPAHAVAGPAQPLSVDAQARSQ